MFTKENKHADASIMEQDFDDKPTELHTFIKDGNWERAADVAIENPDQAKTWVVRYDSHNDKENRGTEKEDREVKWRFLPIHSACARQPTDELIEVLLFIYPEAAAMKDLLGMLPLHYACGNQSSHSVINMLLIAHPQGAEERDVYGKLPIHHTFQWQAPSPEVISMLLTVYPESVFELDSDGKTPLDLAKAGKYDDRSSIITLARCATAAAIRAESAAMRAETLESNAEEIMAYEQEIDALRKEKEELSSELDAHRKEANKPIGSDSEQVIALKSDLAKARTEYDNIKRELDETFEERASTQLEASRLEEKCDISRRELEEVQKERDGMRDKVSIENDRSQEIIDRLEEEVSENITDMKSLCAKELSHYASAVNFLSMKQKSLEAGAFDRGDKIKTTDVQFDNQLLEIAVSGENRRRETVDFYEELKESLENKRNGLMVMAEAIKGCGVVEERNYLSPEQPLE